MKKKIFLFSVLFFSLGVLGILLNSGFSPDKYAEELADDSLKTKSPESIAKNFLIFMNENKPAEAKKLCLPSAIEFINNQAKSNIFFKEQNKWNDSIQITDVVLGNDGNTAIVHYNIGDYNNKIQLINEGKEWKISYSNELLGCKIVEIQSWDLMSPDNYNKYVGMRLRIKDILYYTSAKAMGDTLPGYVFVAYDSVANKVSMQQKYNPGYFNQQYTFYYKGTELNSWKEERDNLFFIFETPASVNLAKATIKGEGEKLNEHFFYTFYDIPVVAEGTLYNNICNGSYISRHTCKLYLSNAVLISGTDKK